MTIEVPCKYPLCYIIAIIMHYEIHYNNYEMHENNTKEHLQYRDFHRGIFAV